tara:strand:- start:85 stop:345 length:261 start_codon:yes stop_codon:yes gene_type:complete
MFSKLTKNLKVPRWIIKVEWEAVICSDLEAAVELWDKLRKLIHLQDKEQVHLMETVQRYKVGVKLHQLQVTQREDSIQLLLEVVRD